MRGTPRGATCSMSPTIVGTKILPEIDEIIVQSLDEIARRNELHWDYRLSGKELKHQSLYQYPAMMVVALQRELMLLIKDHQPGVRVVADPFVGSGSILTASLFLGLDFVGQDINPLAILLCRAKALCRDVELLGESVEQCQQRVREDKGEHIEVEFFNREKWFTAEACVSLSKLRRAICQESSLEARLFLWVTLAETVRNVSNSRTSTFKLHIRPPEERNVSAEKVIKIFDGVVADNLLKITEFVTSLTTEKGNMPEMGWERDEAKPPVLRLGDSVRELPGRNGKGAQQNDYDLVVTSPPYGDNLTTVPYGQAAWLPLQWIDAADIDAAAVIDRNNAYAVDCRSVGGGSKPRQLSRKEQDVWQEAELEKLEEISPAVRAMAAELKDQPADGLRRFVCFASDLKEVLENVSAACAPNAYLIWTLGHRRIRGIECPMAEIVTDFFGHVGVQEVHRITRSIQSKRMPSRNQISSTIKQEYILIMRKLPVV